MSTSRHHGQAPRSSLLHPMLEPVTRGDPSDEAFVARCLLGAGWVGASRRLSMLDLRVWAALCGMFHGQHLRATGEHDPDLDSRVARMVHTTGYQLADRVWADDGGAPYRRLLQSLGRLASARVLMQTVEPDLDLAALRVHAANLTLIGDIGMESTRLNPGSPREWGALKGSTSLRVEIGYWPAQQIVAQRCTWLDLDLLRALGPGLSARLFAALEAWARWPQRSMDGAEETAIGLGRPALESLGVGGYERGKDARAALNRAGAKIVAVDPAYQLVRCEKRGGWCLVIRRVSGARARAAARRDAPWRSPGIVATRRQRAERAAVRAQAHASLADGSS